jgi:hypothetical protein
MTSNRPLEEWANFWATWSPLAQSWIISCTSQAQQSIDRRTGELNGSLSGSDRFTLLPTGYGQLCTFEFSVGFNIRTRVQHNLGGFGRI